MAYALEIVTMAVWAVSVVRLWRRRDYRALVFLVVMYVGALTTLSLEIMNEMVIKGTYYPTSLIRLPGLQLPVAVVLQGSLYSLVCVWVMLRVSDSRYGSRVRPRLAVKILLLLAMTGTCFISELLFPYLGYFVFVDPSATSLHYPGMTYLYYSGVTVPPGVLAIFMLTREGQIVAAER